jgi:hypothetical protein
MVCNWPFEICCGARSADVLLEEILARAGDFAAPGPPTPGQLHDIISLANACKGHACELPHPTLPGVMIPFHIHCGFVVEAWKKACAGPVGTTACGTILPESIPDWDAVIDELDHGGGGGDPPECDFSQYPAPMRWAIDRLARYFERHGDPRKPWKSAEKFCACLQQYLRERKQAQRSRRSLTEIIEERSNGDGNN